MPDPAGDAERLIAGFEAARADETARRDRPPRFPRRAVMFGVGGALAVAAALLLVFRPTSEDSSAKLRDEVERLQPFVERERGLQFRRDVEVEVVTDDELRGSTSEEDAMVVSLSAADLWLRAFALVPPDVDYRRLARLIGAGTGAIYDQRRDVMLLPDRPLSPFTRSLIVHELTHALDDQHFDLEAVYRESQRLCGGVCLGTGALVEGNAARIEERFVASLPAEQRAAAGSDKASLRRSSEQMPAAIRRLLFFPYTEGAEFVTALVAEGGEAEVNRAFEHPPYSTWQVIEPDEYLADGIPQPALGTPETFGTVVGSPREGTIDPFGLSLILADAIGSKKAGAVAREWLTDAYVAWRGEGKACVSALIWSEASRSTARLVAAFRRWAALHPRAKVSGSDPVRVSNCEGYE